MSNGELLLSRICVFLQPIVLTNMVDVIAAEALLRYKDSSDNSAKLVIMEIDRLGLHKDVDFYVLGEVVKIIKRSGKQFYVSVNLFPSTLKIPGISEDILNILYENNILNDSIQFEINEATDICDIHFIANIKAISEAGYNLMIDDFGTCGFNMLTLADYNISDIKLDKGFMNNCTNRKKIVLKHITQLCNEFDWSVIAEGVETMEQLMLARDLGCNKIQGYLVGEPVHIDEFMDTYMLASNYL